MPNIMATCFQAPNLDKIRRGEKLSLAKTRQKYHLIGVRAVANNGKNLENSAPEAQYAPGGRVS
jgi:hypothetical protein